MGLLDRLITRRAESEPGPASTPRDEPVFATKALRKFVACLASRESPILLDLGAVVGSNVSFFGDQLGCKMFVENIYDDLERHIAASRVEAFPDFLKTRFSGRVQSVDGILCWDLIDYLDRRSAIALTEQLSGLLRPEGALLGFFGTAQARDRSYSKYVVVDGVNMKQRAYPATRGRQTVLQNRDIIRLFPSLRVSDSFLLQNSLREILFRKPAWSGR
jgi:hypothetical protein